MKILFIILLTLLFLTSDLLACKCEGPFSVEEEFDYAETIFLGKIIKTEFVSLGETINPDSLKVARELAKEKAKAFLDGPLILKSTFLIQKHYKGEIQKDTTTVYTAMQSSACGYKFELGKSYIVYAYGYSNMYIFLNIDGKRAKGFTMKDTYWTSHCTRTTENVREEQKLLGKYLAKK